MICCPVCGSTGIYLVAGGYTGMLYRCKQCGYEGAFVIEEDQGPEEGAGDVTTEQGKDKVGSS
ncbi:MAG: hypothetical protein JXA08_03980 [Methanomicrobiaceae archaeon]|nr:hypothetical protein [Methanomicrobiaceae archaeon]